MRCFVAYFAEEENKAVMSTWHRWPDIWTKLSAPKDKKIFRPLPHTVHNISTLGQPGKEM